MNSKIFLIICLTVSLVPTPILSGYPSSGYGYEYNKYPYLPAPPGRTPSCANFGKTYCEKVDTYPHEAIQYLLFKWGDTYSQFIKTERDEDFVLMVMKETYGYGHEPRLPNYSPGYGAPSNSHYNQVVHNNSASSYNYNPQPVRPPSYQFQPSPPYFNAYQAQHELAAVIIPPILHTIWWNHRDKVTHQPAFPYLPQNRFHRIQKRQASSEEDQLCPSVTKFTVPQAAMNNEGNWMYVVNMGNITTTYAQQVRTEECRDGDRKPCNGLCQVPPGFSATCRQKFVQKRLVALHPDGDKLITEVFWFSHGCVCEIVKPNTNS